MPPNKYRNWVKRKRIPIREYPTCNIDELSWERSSSFLEKLTGTELTLRHFFRVWICPDIIPNNEDDNLGFKILWKESKKRIDAFENAQEIMTESQRMLLLKKFTVDCNPQFLSIERMLDFGLKPEAEWKRLMAQWIDGEISSPPSVSKEEVKKLLEKDDMSYCQRELLLPCPGELDKIWHPEIGQLIPYIAASRPLFEDVREYIRDFTVRTHGYKLLELGEMNEIVVNLIWYCARCLDGF